jgi:hypothetical protein
LDKPKPITLGQPPDEVLQGVIYLEPDVHFRGLVAWLEASYKTEAGRLIYLKEDAELRVTQGRCQALLSILAAATKPREMLAERIEKARQNAVNPNV